MFQLKGSCLEALVRSALTLNRRFRAGISLAVQFAICSKFPVNAIAEREIPPVNRASQRAENRTQARRDALLAAERSGMMEGLPPASTFAREQGEQYAKGEITADEAVAAIIHHYSTHPGRPISSK
jgi:hypothetical protein